MAAAALSEPGQCSLYFDPKQWSKRYEETFFTCIVAGHIVRDATPAFVIQLHAGALNSWQVTHTAAEFEAFAAKVAAELKARPDATVVPELPAKKFSLISEDTSSEYLAQRTVAFDKWLASTLGASRVVSVLPSVRAFLDLDRQLEREPEEPTEDEPMAEEAKAQ